MNDKEQKRALLREATRQTAAIIFGRDLETVQETQSNGTISRVEWARPEDGQTFALEGKIVMHEATKAKSAWLQLVWRFRLPSNAFGRWRNHSSDPVATIGADGVVTVTEPEEA